jgi:hypothetical protein
MPSHPTPRTHDSTCFHRPRRPWSNPVCPLQQGAVPDSMSCSARASHTLPVLARPRCGSPPSRAGDNQLPLGCGRAFTYHPPHNACFVTDASRLSTQVVSPGDQRCNAKTVAKRRSVRADAASTFRYITILSIVDWFGSPWSSPCTVYGNLGRRCSCRCEMNASQVKLDGALTSLERWQARQYLPWLLLRRCTSSDVA